MHQRAWVDPRIASVRVASVQSYLLRHGWQQRPYPQPELLVFQGPPDDNGEPIIQIVPSSEGMRDFGLRMEELIAALSVLEGRLAQDILTDILQENPVKSGQPGVEQGSNGAVPGPVSAELP